MQAIAELLWPLFVLTVEMLCFLQYTQEYARLYRLSQSWQSMKQKINVGQELAEKTLAYWQRAPIKVLVCVTWNSSHDTYLS